MRARTNTFLSIKPTRRNWLVQLIISSTRTHRFVINLCRILYGRRHVAAPSRCQGYIRALYINEGQKLLTLHTPMSKVSDGRVASVLLSEICKAALDVVTANKSDDAAKVTKVDSAQVAGRSSSNSSELKSPTFTEPVVNLTFDPRRDCPNLSPCRLKTRHLPGDPVNASGRSSRHVVMNCPRRGDCCECKKSIVTFSCGTRTQSENEVRSLYGLGASVEEDDADAVVFITAAGRVGQTHVAQFKLKKFGEETIPPTQLSYFTEGAGALDASVNYRVIGLADDYTVFEVAWTPRSCTPLDSAVCIRNKKTSNLAYLSFRVVGHLEGYVPPAQSIAPPCCGPQSDTNTPCPCKKKVPNRKCFARRPRLYAPGCGCASS